jgi:hypothetical protein
VWFFLINFLPVNRLKLIFAIRALNKICWLWGRWDVGRIVSFSLHAEIGFLGDTGVQPLECEQCLRREVPLQPWLDCRIAAGNRKWISGRG